ncbi:MAG: MerR family transcriptional regulator, partial [Clostridia bacterium]|nr:MerR family transcriptional regulator [Clostridia bacterium]
MIRIGDFAKICNVTTQTLRYYDTVGVLKADVIDSSNGYRFYSLDAIEKYKQILFYKELGFSLSEIKAINLADKAQQNIILQQRKQVLAESMKKVDSQMKMIDDICKNDSNDILLSDVFLMPFENDSKVVGKWRLCGKIINKTKLTTIEDGIPKEVDKEIIFMPGGAVGWKYFWTKGVVYRISPKYKFAIPNTYDTVEHNNTNYMIIQFMSDECIDNGEDNIPLLYQKVDCMQYTEKQIRMKVDKTDIPFVEDKRVCGVWSVVDFVTDVLEFSADTDKCDTNVFPVK